MGIYLANRLSEVPKRKKAIAQVYITDPYLIDGSKFDLRLYVYVTSVDPLRLYIHRNGLVRFASQKYTNNAFHTRNNFHSDFFRGFSKDVRFFGAFCIRDYCYKEESYKCVGSY